jgi:catechol 2,3-dioxygenase-like lactoylglutathione lyase family enzyme
MDWTLELIVLPVSDVDRAKRFYVEQLGFDLDVDHSTGTFRVVQATPHGSACSVSFGSFSQGKTERVTGLHLVVSDIEAAHAELLERGIECSDPYHFGPAGRAPGLDPNRAKYGTFLSFEDPDGNSWVVQEVDRTQG